MKKLINYPVVAMLLIGATFILSSCQKDEPLNNNGLNENTTKSQNGNTFYGPAVPFGNGVARAWMSEDPDGNPTGVGVNLSEKALEGLPEEPTQTVLYFPNHGATDFYTHILLDWNPQGHEPGFYEVPHFDFHFYIIPVEERLAIGPNDTVEFAADPLPQYIPPAYLHTQGGVPQMGAHWVDLLAPEFTGGSFTRTFIWGSYDGDFIFWEPMVTMDYLQLRSSEVIPVRQPEAYLLDGWYATDYKVEYNTKFKQYSVSLINLVHHSGE
jgi:hypothetical protein